MPAFELEMHKCCCCFTLRTGTLIIGYLNLVVSLVALLFAAFLFVDATFVNPAEQDSDIFEAYLWALFLSVIIFNLIFVSLLLYGSHKDKPEFLVPWMVLYVANLLFEVVTGIVLLFDFLANPLTNILILLFSIGRLLFSFYCFACVYMFYRELKQQRANA